MKKGFSLITLITILVAGVSFVPPKRAGAQFVVTGAVEVFGGPVLVNDLILEAQVTTGVIADAGRFAIETILRAILETLKKRILDTITDQIIAWIRTGDEPQFIGNFGAVLEQAANDSVGEVIQNSQYAEFCSPNYGPLVRISVRQPGRFSRTPACTLTEIVGNIDAFTQNFENGGYIALNSLATNPQNNRFGLKLLVADQLIIDTDKKEKEATLKAQANSGFTSTARCIRWTRVVANPAGGNQLEVFPADGQSSVFGFPWQPSYYNSATPPPGIGWVCSSGDQQITTPGTTKVEGTNRALYSNIDYVVNSTEISTYLAALADAALNRLISEGVNGLRSLTSSQTTAPTAGGPPPFQIITPGQGLLQASSSYGNARNSATQQNIQTILSLLTPALASLQAANGNINQLLGDVTAAWNTLAELETCLGSCTVFYNTAPDLAWVASSRGALSVAEANLTSISADIAQITADLATLQANLGGPNALQYIAQAQSLITQANALNSQFSQSERTIRQISAEATRRRGNCFGTPTVSACTPP